jgi:membrane protein DedA with SNARE-associated domain
MNESLLSAAYFSTLSYPALVLAGLFAQPYASLVCGSLAAAGVFNIAEVFAIFFLTDIVMDCVWYALGHRHGERTLNFLKRIIGAKDEDMAHLSKHFHERPALVLLSTKLVGAWIAPLVFFTAGAARLPFWRYLALNAFGEIFWSGGFLAIGYYFGGYIFQVNTVIEQVTTGAFALIIVTILLWAGRRLYERLLQK